MACCFNRYMCSNHIKPTHMKKRFSESEKELILQYAKSKDDIKSAVCELAEKLNRTKCSIYYFIYRHFGKTKWIDWTKIDEDICYEVAKRVENLHEAFSIVAMKHNLSVNTISSRWYTKLKENRKVFQIKSNYCGMAYTYKQNCKNSVRKNRE